MLVIATFMVVPAKLHRNCARTSGTSIAPAAAPATPPLATGMLAALAGDFAISCLGSLSRNARKLEKTVELTALSSCSIQAGHNCGIDEGIVRHGCSTLAERWGTRHDAGAELCMHD